MLNENIKNLRKAKGLSQEELAIKLSVVRQTVSKWEKGLSVPDAEMLVSIAEALDTSVATLLDTKEIETEASEYQKLATKLELLNEQIAKQTERRRKALRIFFIILGTITAINLINIASRFIMMFLPLLSNDTAIIGGADGPTAIFVTSIATPIFVLALILAVSAIVIFKTRRK